jgi:N-acetylglucosaminyldiphosphoundecaprenol N-acetyl-beta-D-mannosaminyltransferase
MGGEVPGAATEAEGRAPAASPRPDRIWILGVPVDRVTRRQALARAESFLGTGACHLVFTPNPEIIMAARGDLELRRILAAADLALADGVGVAWAAARGGRPVPERVPGIDFAGDVLALAARRSLPVFLLGTRREVVARAADAARARYPGLRVAGWHDGYFPMAEAASVAERVRASGARILLVGMGAPREQRFLWQQRERLGVELALAVGGSLDVLGGAVRLAPQAIRRIGLEWLWRLLREPTRLRRQMALPAFGWTILTAKAPLWDDASGLDGR